MSALGVKVVCIFLHSDWRRRDTEYLSVSLRIQSKCEKVRTRITPNTNTSYAVIILSKFMIAEYFGSTDISKNNLKWKYFFVRTTFWEYTVFILLNNAGWIISEILYIFLNINRINQLYFSNNEASRHPLYLKLRMNMTYALTW